MLTNVHKIYRLVCIFFRRLSYTVRVKYHQNHHIDHFIIFPRIDGIIDLHETKSTFFFITEKAPEP